MVHIFKTKDGEVKFKTNYFYKDDIKISFVKITFLPEYLWSSVALKGISALFKIYPSFKIY